MNKDLDNLIIAQVSEGPCNVSDLCRAIKARKRDVITSYQKLVKYGILQSRRERNEIILMISSELQKFFPNFDDFIRIMMDKINPHMERLAKIKRLGHHLVKKEGQTLTSVDSNASRELDNVIYLLNFIGTKYALPYSYAEHLGILPGNFKSTLRHNQKMCAEVTAKIVKNLLRTHKNSEKELSTYLSWKLDSYMIFDKNFDFK